MISPVSVLLGHSYHSNSSQRGLHHAIIDAIATTSLASVLPCQIDPCSQQAHSSTSSSAPTLPLRSTFFHRAIPLAAKPLDLGHYDGCHHNHVVDANTSSVKWADLVKAFFPGVSHQAKPYYVLMEWLRSQRLVSHAGDHAVYHL